MTYIYSNLLGNESGRAIFDGDAMIASDGVLLELGHRLSFKKIGLTTTTIDIDSTRMTRARSGSFEPEVDGDETDVIHAKFELPKCQLEAQTVTQPEWETKGHLKCEEFTRAVCLGLFDYVCKSRSRGFVVSMSGGADSAACATLVATALGLAVNELGMDDAVERMGSWWINKDRKPTKKVMELVERSLTTVYQATRNSGDVTRNAAKDVAEAIGAKHLEFDVDSLVTDYREMVEKANGYELTWDEHDITLQNIQARVRSPGVWMLANLNYALLLSNK